MFSAAPAAATRRHAARHGRRAEGMVVVWVWTGGGGGRSARGGRCGRRFRGAQSSCRGAPSLVWRRRHSCSWAHQLVLDRYILLASPRARSAVDYHGTVQSAALSFASRDPMTVAPGGLAIFLGRLTPPPIMWPRLRNVKRGTLFVLAARTDPSIMTLLLCKNRSFNFQRPMLDQTHPHTHIPYQTRFQACVFSNGASGRLSQQPIPDMAVSGQEVATGLGDLGRVCDTEVWTRRSRLI